MDQLSYRRHRFPPPIIQHAIRFCSSSTSAILSSVIGSSVVAGGSRNSTVTHLPGDHLSLTRAPGSKFWGIPPDARSPPKFHHERGR
jgi:hypothetical protein